jgi:hypothetical protein
MPGGAIDPLEFLLFIVTAALLGGFAFIGTLEAWSRWSDNRRMRKLWSSRAKEAKQHREKMGAKGSPRTVPFPACGNVPSQTQSER